MAYIDLHIHSIYSNGIYTPEELLCYAKNKELSAVSLMDHNIIKGLERVGKQAENLGVNLLTALK